jgi:peptidoglycan hydrolase-like protein with peptidoglycan-binding domain
MSTHAQSVNDCIIARQADAENICNSVLASGSRNVDVYWKLSSAQFEDGKQDLANKTLDRALSLYPGNARLLSLRERISAASTENAMVIRSSKISQSSVDKGAVKITCLIKTGAEAISACEQRLKLTNEDGDRIRARLAALKLDQKNTEVAAVSAPATQPSVQTTAAVVAPTAAELAAQASKNAYKALVAEVQVTLNEFGFTAGSPDGVPGGKTRNALSDFYTTIGAPVSTSITAATLEDLTRERRNLAKAEQLLRRSEQSIQQGNSQLADRQLADARNASTLLQVPVQHEQAVRIARLAVATESPFPVVTAPVTTLAQIPTQTQITNQAPAVVQSPPVVEQIAAITPTPVVVQAPVVNQAPAIVQAPIVVQTATSISQQFTQLMGQINILQGQIRRKQADQVQQLDRMRNVL